VDQVVSVKISFPSCHVEAFDPRDKSAVFVVIDNRTPRYSSLSKRFVWRHPAAPCTKKLEAECSLSSRQIPVNPEAWKVLSSSLFFLPK